MISGVVIDMFEFFFRNAVNTGFTYHDQNFCHGDSLVGLLSGSKHLNNNRKIMTIRVGKNATFFHCLGSECSFAKEVSNFNEHKS